ncbi:MAG: DNA-binding LytR/AlgR family response regulator [Paraglaciecola sp.]|jgi:DNA-binding LytR/AlgR family response regulator
MPPFLNRKSMNLTCILVDDDLMCRKSLERLIKKNGQLDILHICENAKDALEILQTTPVDLLFLDVEMPDLTGIELLEKLPVLPQVIFTTSKTEYAHEAFEYQAVDYLKKPITFPRFQVAVHKAIEQSEKNDNFKQTTKEIYIREDRKFIRLDFDDILFFENAGDYVRIKTATGSHIIHGTLSGIAEKLEDPRFLKVHRSFIINLQKIKDIEDGSLVIEKTVIPISRAHKTTLMSRLNFL